MSTSKPPQDLNYMFQNSYWGDLDYWRSCSKDVLLKEIRKVSAEHVNSLKKLKIFQELGGDVKSSHNEIKLNGYTAYSFDEKESVKSYLLKNPRTSFETIEVFEILLGKNFKNDSDFIRFLGKYCSEFSSVQDWEKLEETLGVNLVGLEPLVSKISYEESKSAKPYDDCFLKCQERLDFIESSKNNKLPSLNLSWDVAFGDLDFFEDKVEVCLSDSDRSNYASLAHWAFEETPDSPVEVDFFKSNVSNLDVCYFQHLHHGFSMGVVNLIQSSLLAWKEGRPLSMLSSKSSGEDKDKLFDLLFNVASHSHHKSIKDVFSAHEEFSVPVRKNLLSSIHEFFTTTPPTHDRLNELVSLLMSQDSFKGNNIQNHMDRMKGLNEQDSQKILESLSGLPFSFSLLKLVIDASVSEFGPTKLKKDDMSLVGRTIQSLVDEKSISRELSSQKFSVGKPNRF